ncbi:toll/interleukin-1 receptor domain-containing protein [Segetibacter sp.]|jgi:hypothetical protein|uniref:toll/interleukin-1 receptor domain-containing protein n=1 Tax=Segetibacter sp. TaxID=2231182 RepID=UPI00263A185F|nr:toll/interleukin-1 receptor domain-containing protein [Segetibacter sp.]MCW3078576.1 toll/interleukin receptor protein [Segetibacter sp.]
MPLNAVKKELEWDKLVATIKEGNAIPIIGNEMYKFEEVGTNEKATVDSYISHTLLKQVDLSQSQLLTILETISLIKKTTAYTFDDIEKAVEEIVGNMIERLQKSEITFPLIQKLIGISGFDFYVNTTVYGSILQAIIEKAHPGTLTIIDFKRNKNFGTDTGKITRNKQLNIFGSCEHPPSAISEEDMLETTILFKEKMINWQPELLNQLERKKIVFLGCTHPDWFNRFFIRITSNKALDTWNTEQPILVNDEFSLQQEKFEFFKKNKALIYEKGTDEFVKELARQWQEKNPTKQHIFISYSHQDKTAADTLVETLSKIDNVECWIDSKFLAPGSDYPKEITSQIKSCDLFIPLISNNSLSNPSSYVMDEWYQARIVNRDKMDANLPYLFPINISKDTDFAHPTIKKNFASDTYTITPVLDGKPDQNCLNLIEQALNKIAAKAY